MALNSTRLRDSIVSKIEAITDFPVTGQNPIIQDKRVIFAIADAIVEEIVANADVLPMAHTGTGLQNPSGQPVTVDTSTGIGSTTSPEDITGMGKIQ